MSKLPPTLSVAVEKIHPYKDSATKKRFFDSLRAAGLE